ncbi:ABC transporter ATP-binding protein [Roseovarius sp.]|uniref:ABC transporter ATP-binding protein n=1 Tax=Roseovarius sp. TaxID=1486281 RepID=UPI00261E6F34|nr:ABC transporter ATP-binding protein [Roseovarius sp.]MDM8165800.1 ABC transporter ATP-binding protein [Roseovarius sp.]
MSDGTTGPVLEVENLGVELPTRSGPLQAVQGVDLTITPGETLCVVGESGCGKSMTSLAIMGLLPKAAKVPQGRISFKGTNLLELGPREMSTLRGDRIAMIFQEPMTSLNPVFTIGDQLTETLRRHRKVTRKQAVARAVELLELVGISGAERRLRQYPYQLSGGLRQRVMIAMALMCDPELLIADEPTTALDVTIQAQILGLLAKIQKELGTAIMLITHDLGVVSRIADKVAVMYAGQIVETGSAERVFRDPLHPYTQGLLRCIPVPGKTRRGEPLGTIRGMVPNLVGEMGTCHFLDRCPFAHDACRTRIPLFEPEAGHAVRCVRTLEEMRASQPGREETEAAR